SDAESPWGIGVITRTLCSLPLLSTTNPWGFVKNLGSRHSETIHVDLDTIEISENKLVTARSSGNGLASTVRGAAARISGQILAFSARRARVLFPKPFTPSSQVTRPLRRVTAPLV